MVDNKKLNFIYAIEISYLPDKYQLLIYQLIQDKRYRLTEENVDKLKKLLKEDLLDEPLVTELLLVAKDKNHMTNYHKKIDGVIKKYKIP